MQISIDGHQIDSNNLWEWSNDKGQHHDQPWIKALAQAAISWLNNDNYITINTSGSTGKPKTIRHSKKSMIASTQKTGSRFNLLSGMNTLNCLPAQYIAGQMMLVRALVLDLNQICIAPTLNIQLEKDTVIDFAPMTPMQLETTIDSAPQVVAQIRKIIIGGAPILSSLKNKIQNIDTRCYATYGMTETITHVATAPVNGPHQTDVFEAIDGVFFSEKDGNLVIVANHISTSPIHTTDQITLMDDQHFRWLGRADHVINSGGVKIHPEVVEQKLQNSIKDRYIITSVSDDLSGQKMVLLIESSPYLEEKLNVLNTAIDGLPKLERPREVYFVRAFEETASRKIRRSADLYGL